jgi:hypothetical protein
MGRAVAPAMRQREVHQADLAQHVVAWDHPVDDDVDDLALLLEAAAQAHHRGRHDGAGLLFEPVGPEDAIGDPGLVLDRDEQHAARRTGTLAE